MLCVTFAVVKGVLAIRVDGDQILQNHFGLREFPLIHAFSCVPIQILLLEQQRELVSNPLEHCLNRRVIAHAGCGQLERFRWNFHHRRAQVLVIRKPGDKLTRMLVLQAGHLQVGFLG